MPRVVVLGANGQLGTDLCRHLAMAGMDLVPLLHSDLDVCDHAIVAARLGEIEPAIVINTTAFHKVEACEEDIERAFAVNCYAVRNLAVVCNRINARLMHISTDYVFGGDRQTPFPEDAPLHPLNTYGVSKAAGEYFVRNLGPQHVVVRTSGLYGVAGASGKGGNFVETMLRLGRERGWVAVVTDQVLSPTYTDDLAAKITELAGANAQGIFHVTSSWACSWYDFAHTIFELGDQAVEVRPTTAATMGGTVVRPSYSVLANVRLQQEGFSLLRPGREALTEYLAARIGAAEWNAALR